jgi:2',3'-cyclic-nucleotide 2'-phosphodiesterase/3'-nucleotidase
MLKELKVYLLATIAVAIALIIISPKAEADAGQKETLDIRIIGTTDLHGQLNSKDYELGVDYNNGGLARVYDLIKKTRSEVPKANSILLDAGDVLFDYTTEYIFSENQNAIQPIYQAMAKMGYDAITLGNHEFDYGYEYLLKQLNGSGMRDITVVSNVMDSKSSEFPFLENMIITRKIKTSSGKNVEVKIGIIGQTIPVLTAKTHSYTGILKTEDMVANAKVQAAKLKEMGADIVIALSHTGIGPENPELNFKNVAYALTKIDDIDVVVCGHEHNLFPTTDMTSPYLKLPNVDKKSFLMNGKNVIMAGDRGEAIGVVDLTLEVSGDGFDIVNRRSELRMVTEKTTVEENSIAGLFGDWEDLLLNYSTDVLATLKKDTELQNFFGLLGDNSAIQLLNDAKINYATRYVNTVGKDYINYPIVAVSTYASYGVASVNDFINIKDKITESDLTSIQPYNNYIYIYTITGKQLKEWLEWSASAYETTNFDTSWDNFVMNDLMKKTGLKSLIKEEWLEDWSNFHVFDGIDYVIDPSKNPRYDLSGNIIDSSRRISSIKYNGTNVSDSMKFLLVSNKITQPQDANKGVEKQVVLNGFVRTQGVLAKYISQLNVSGSVIPQIDNNWRLSLPNGSKFIVKMPHYADELFKGTSWYKEHLTEVDQYNYYTASYQQENADIIAPHIVATPVVIGATGSPYEVGVHIVDASKIKNLKYLDGDYNKDYNGWVIASTITNNHFTVRKNGVYSIYAEDDHGNKTVYKLTIDNFSDNLLGTPTIDSYTNRKSKISGRAEPNAKIIFEAYTGTYQSKVSGNGTFSYALPSQPSGSIVNVHVEAKGLVSAKASVMIKRTGPNQPSINPVNNTDGYILGETKDKDMSTIIAIVGNTAYVPKNGGKELFVKNTEVYSPSYKIVETEAEFYNSGFYTIIIPPQTSGQVITVYSLDHLSRNSRAISTTVLEAAPDAPVVYEISNIEDTINGYVPTTTKKEYDITITIGKDTYETKSDKEGKFSYQFGKQLIAGQKVTITASDSKNGSERTSYETMISVQNIEKYVKANSTSLTLNKITDKSYLISGYYDMDLGTVNIAMTKGTGSKFESTLVSAETNKSGRFNYSLEENLEAGMTIYAMVRFTDGNIILVNKTVVKAGKPDMPILYKEVTNADKDIQIIASKDAKITLLLGDKEYSTTKYKLEKASGNYVYTIAIDNAVSGTEMKISASNEAGTSDVLVAKVMKVAPDQPTVNVVKAGAKKITGKVQLIQYQEPVPEGEEIEAQEEQIPERFKDAPEKVAKTQTRVFAKIGSKTYEGTISDSGKFTIEIPAQKKGAEIKLWGSNKAGNGPYILVIVTGK